MIKWVVGFREYDLSYEPQAIKAHALADFLAEFTPSTSVNAEAIPRDLQIWNIYVDGLSSREGSGVGLLLESLEGQECCYFLRFNWRASNNDAAYPGSKARSLSIENI